MKTKQNAITIHDVARECGKSRQVVSAALNDKSNIRIAEWTRRDIKQAAERLGYHPNRAAQFLKTGRTNSICITTMHGDVGHSVYASRIFKGISDVFGGTGYRLSFGSYWSGSGGALLGELAAPGEFDGCILLLFSLDIHRIRREGTGQFGRLSVPTVAVSSVSRPFGMYNVGLNCAAAGELAAAHLAGHGYTGIQLVRPGIQSEYLDDFEAGYTGACARAGIGTDVAEVPGSDAFTFESGYRWMDARLRTGTTVPRAMVLAEEGFACGVYRRVVESGIRVPGDLALIAFGNLRNEALGVSGITCVTQPAYAKGERAGALLQEILKGKAAAESNNVLTPELVVRSSCGCAQPHVSVVPCIL